MSRLTSGMTVKVKGAPGVYTVLEGPDRQGRYVVARGSITTRVAESDLLSHELAESKQSYRPPVPSGRGTLRVDFHGKKVQEAVAAFEQLLDRALREGYDAIEVIHGIGGGKVRDAIHAYCATSRHVSAHKLAEGNPGTTFVYL